MRTLEWSTSHAVFVTEMDDEHKQIFQALGALEEALSGRTPVSEAGQLSQILLRRIDDHFAHEERLMRAARYYSYPWHKRKHDNARKLVGQYVSRIGRGEFEVGGELIGYLRAWLDEHTRLPDTMLGAFLRNHSRGICKITFRAGTKPLDACAWVDSNGERLDPAESEPGY